VTRQLRRQKEEAIEKLVTKNADGEQDLSRWREADVVDIAYTDYLIPEDVRGPVEGDMFFKNKVALMVLKEFQEQGGVDGSEGVSGVRRV